MLAVIPITAAWLAQQGTAPYLLAEPDSTYVLEADVATNGTAFIVTAENVTLDLNGHTVTYGNSTPVTLTNGDFELGTEQTVPGWNLDNAPNASLAATTHYLFGNNSLKFENLTNSQTIVSDPISIGTANREYAATITPKGTYASVSISVVDVVTGDVLVSGQGGSNPSRGFSSVLTFVPTTTNDVRLEVEVSSSGGTANSPLIPVTVLFCAIINPVRYSAK